MSNVGAGGSPLAMLVLPRAWTGSGYFCNSRCSGVLQKCSVTAHFEAQHTAFATSSLLDSALPSPCPSCGRGQPQVESRDTGEGTGSWAGRSYASHTLQSALVRHFTVCVLLQGAFHSEKSRHATTCPPHARELQEAQDGVGVLSPDPGLGRSLRFGQGQQAGSPALPFCPE